MGPGQRRHPEKRRDLDMHLPERMNSKSQFLSRAGEAGFDELVENEYPLFYLAIEAKENRWNMMTSTEKTDIELVKHLRKISQ